MEDVPDLPNFSRFHDRFRENPKSMTLEGDMRPAFYMAYDDDNCEYIKLDEQGDRRAARRRVRELVSANFVIPYPPGFPIMVPGQVITADTIDVHAQARREGDPRLRRRPGPEADQTWSALGDKDAREEANESVNRGNDRARKPLRSESSAWRGSRRDEAD